VFGCIDDEVILKSPVFNYTPSKVGREIIKSSDFFTLHNKMQVPFSTSISRLSDSSVFFMFQDSRFIHSVFAGGLALELGELYGYDPLLSELGGLTHDFGHGWASHATDGIIDHHAVVKRLLNGENPVPASSAFLETLSGHAIEYRFTIPSILEKHGISGRDVAAAIKLPSVQFADDLSYSLRDALVCGLNRDENKDYANFTKWVNGLERTGDNLFFKDEENARSFAREHSKRTLYYYNTEGSNGRVSLLRKYIHVLADTFSTTPEAIAETTCFLLPRWLTTSVDLWSFTFAQIAEDYGVAKKVEKEMGASLKDVGHGLMYDYSRLAYRRPIDKDLLEIKNSRKKRDKLETTLRKKGKRMFVVGTASIAKAQKMHCQNYSGPERPYQHYHDKINDFCIYVYGSHRDVQKARTLCEKELGLEHKELELSLAEVLTL